MFFPPCAYTMCYVLIAFIQPFPIYQALFAQYYIFAAAATTWNPSFYICGHFFPANNRFVSTYSLFAIKLGFLVLCYSLQNILICVWQIGIFWKEYCVKSESILKVIFHVNLRKCASKSVIGSVSWLKSVELPLRRLNS